MRITTAVLLLFVTAPVVADTFSKWVDQEGNTHYGDTPPASQPSQLKLIEIQDTFNQQEHDLAVERNQALQSEIRTIERRELKQKGAAEKRLQKYLDYLDKKDARVKKENDRKRKAREAERNSTSIKMRRTKKKPASERKKSGNHIVPGN
jgi:predicted metal-dependent hydrolase